MGVAVPHHPEAVHRVQLAALVAGDHTGRNVHGAHQDHKARGNVLAKPLLAVKPELVCAVLPAHAGAQGVGVAALAQAGQGGCHASRAVSLAQRRLAQQFSRQAEGAGVEAGRQAHIILQAW